MFTVKQEAMIESIIDFQLALATRIEPFMPQLQLRDMAKNFSDWYDNAQKEDLDNLLHGESPTKDTLQRLGLWDTYLEHKGDVVNWKALADSRGNDDECRDEFNAAVEEELPAGLDQWFSDNRFKLNVVEGNVVFNQTKNTITFLMGRNYIGNPPESPHGAIIDLETRKVVGVSTYIPVEDRFVIHQRYSLLATFDVYKREIDFLQSQVEKYDEDRKQTGSAVYIK